MDPLTAIKIGTTVLSFFGARDARKDAQRLQREQMRIMEEKLQIQREEQAKLDAQRQEFKDMEFVNPYAGFADLFAQQENVFEDLTVDQQAAELQRRNLDQQSANVLQQLQGSAGASGIGALAQQLVNQQAIATSKISADIAKQERQNQMLAAKGEQQLQQQKLKGEILEAQGEGMVQQAEMSRQATLLGMQLASTTGANKAAQQAELNMLYGQNMGNQMQSSALGAFGDVLGILPEGSLDFLSGGGRNLGDIASNAIFNFTGGKSGISMPAGGMSPNVNFDPNASTGGLFDYTPPFQPMTPSNPGLSGPLPAFGNEITVTG